MANHLLLPAATIFLTLLFLSPATATATAADSVVVDIDGNPLEAGSQYYVLTSGSRGAGRGGLNAVPLGGICPLYVGQHRSWNNRGSPVSFYPADLSQKNITLSSDVNIAFGLSAMCRNQGVWQLSSNELGVFYITTNGEIGNPGAETFTNWFKIEKLPFPKSNSYRIVYCFAVPKPGPEPVHVVPDSRRTGPESVVPTEYCQQLDATLPGPWDLSMLSLVPIDNPLPFFGFVFKKVTTTTTTASTTTASSSY
ncbi:hypothetical protein SOVF_044560 [Spinacia oleracea]|uniref:21 kDa seed protein-like n=1 Tax=Spinacia oleracea TaxID=3562 RepID=A0A9R0IB07_SPIOL|nr:21 kDa seed protein-like [Spinacia oleracea]KNA21297.1 hypothetical protein SOVF_044560 [Spinacia oleracea]